MKIDLPRKTLRLIEYGFPATYLHFREEIPLYHPIKMINNMIKMYQSNTLLQVEHQPSGVGEKDRTLLDRVEKPEEIPKNSDLKMLDPVIKDSTLTGRVKSQSGLEKNSD